MKLIPTRTHGILDYLTVATLLLLPRLLGWDKVIASRVHRVALGTALYSLATQYELGWGPLKLFPMKMHLTLDALSGALFCAAPLLIPNEPKKVKNVFVALGLIEILVPLNTQAEPAKPQQ